jgi:hypothetical protein
LTNIDLWEVSIVTFPANQKAVITDVKAFAEKKREWEAAFREGGLSRADSLKAVAVLSTRLYQRDAEESHHATPCDDVSAEERALLESLARLTESTTAAAISAKLSTCHMGAY